MKKIFGILIGILLIYSLFIFLFCDHVAVKENFNTIVNNNEGAKYLDNKKDLKYFTKGKKITKLSDNQGSRDIFYYAGQDVMVKRMYICMAKLIFLLPKYSIKKIKISN